MKRISIAAWQHCFRGSKRSLGWRYCLCVSGTCLHHGIVFGPVENIRKELIEWADVPVEFSLCSCVLRISKINKIHHLTGPGFREQLIDELCVWCRASFT